MREHLSSKNIILAFTLLFTGIVAFNVITFRNQLAELSQKVVVYRNHTLRAIPQPTYAPIPTPHVDDSDPISDDKTIVTQQRDINPTIIYTEPDDALPWGVAQKVDDVTYTIRVGYDETMGTPQEILDALNLYRSQKGVNSLSWDDTLADYARSRAEHFTATGTTDKHEGFNTFLEDENGFEKLRYNRVGENSFFGGQLSGTHLIEWVFSQSPGHDANQLDPGWTHVGIGTTSNAVNLIFGSGKF